MYQNVCRWSAIPTLAGVRAILRLRIMRWLRAARTCSRLSKSVEMQSASMDQTRSIQALTDHSLRCECCAPTYSSSRIDSTENQRNGLWTFQPVTVFMVCIAFAMKSALVAPNEWYGTLACFVACMMCCKGGQAMKSRTRQTRRNEEQQFSSSTPWFRFRA